ncbi:FAD:protein FMN transferase [Isoptericola sp. b441]|uniref:FAD:protein FMN transferase n=1 Tax=Actinotalea lenta TaxID=3064654 RepID=A0ABT9DCD9_9CELL|nr:FAD:protein FMN transferase [Isoptericola sp. b441]MDO8106961.1 FAD:protein FMN transferase [Isoptericola sp. b441]
MVAADDWRALGTWVRLAVTDDAALPRARQMLIDDLGALDLACSRFRDDSEVVALEHARGRATRISPVLADALAVALAAARLTGGDVDPTVGRVMVDLGYDRDLEALVELAGPPRVRPAPGWQRVRLDLERNEVTVPPGVLLDLGATAKARAADLAARRIADALGTGVLVALGGDVRVAGPAPAEGWRVRVQDHAGPPAQEPDGPTLSLDHGGLATSSTSSRRWVRSGTQLHHIVDPRVGFPAWTPWRTVTVAAASAALANAASTAAVIRAERAPAWLAELGLPARLVTRDGAVTTVAGWPVQGVAA